MSSAFADQLTMLRSIAVVAKPDAAAASHIRLNDEADGPYRSDYGDLVTAEVVIALEDSIHKDQN